VRLNLSLEFSNAPGGRRRPDERDDRQDERDGQKQEPEEDRGFHDVGLHRPANLPVLPESQGGSARV